MSRARLNEGVLPCFIKYMIDKPHSFCCRRLNRISLCSLRTCIAARKLFNSEKVLFCNNGEGVSFGSLSERIYITNFNVLRLTIIGLHRLTAEQKTLQFNMFIMANMPDEDELDFFTPIVAQECGQLLKRFFSFARFSIEFDAEGNPFAAMKILPLIQEVMPCIKHVKCSPCQIAWFSGAELDTLQVARKRKREGYCGLNASSVFQVKAKKLISVELFYLNMLLDVEVERLMPNLQCLNLTHFDGTVRWKEPKRIRDYENALHHKFVNNEMSEGYQNAIQRLSWHIQQIIEHSHVKTKLSVQFHVRDENYFKASLELFKDLLVDFYIGHQENAEGDLKCMAFNEVLLFEGRNTEVSVAVDLMR
uniref:FTH domain-containing protein n=1 Tax=Bursaphelenchus xylophilus TaxID=6326 RepID=A0A1I7SV15_BURXY